LSCVRINFTIHKNCQHNRFRFEICTIEANPFLEDFRKEAVGKRVAGSTYKSSELIAAVIDAYHPESEHTERGKP
jgi:hypothetical protein